ncbi:hypothetical protein BDV96DRAFT_608614 [Lophiotrema nucula]|uniref:AMP-dependent synthetase/ligase domain-containing protein n=1 Tax=Lophiotrema nucula TaxID=690887 RepID=A0A6A5ZUC5_9PLEO|nr:hypothetical protein BDV96DRAFT_608614 [Lophiotrema nucula]
MSFWNTVLDPSGSGDVPFGSRLIPTIIDELASTEPHRICFSFPRSTEIADGFRDVGFRTFANAINKTAHFIHQEIGRSSMFETVMYMGYPDVRHYIVLVALMKTGHKVLFSSHRNSVAGHADLIRKTDCTVLMHTAGFPANGILEKCRMETLCMPELDYLLDDAICEPYPYTRTWEEAQKHPCLVLHSSGSTGLPKPIVWTHSMFGMMDAQNKVPPLDGRLCVRGAFANDVRRFYSTLPIYHAGGLAAGIARFCFNKNTVVIGPPETVTAEIVDQVLQFGDVDAAHFLPETLEQIAHHPNILAKLGRLTHVMYGGGPLAEQVGKTIARHVLLLNGIGSTETSYLVLHTTDKEDFSYICLNEAYSGIEMRPIGDLFELVFVRDQEHEIFQGAFVVYPRLKEYSMSDLYSKHPTKPHHWKLEGRKDDMIVLKNGWNVNPIVHEQLITNHPAVQNCVLVGRGQDKPAAIIELRSDYYTEEKERQKSVAEAIWPNIDKANSVAATPDQLDRHHIIFAKKEKPFAIASKGTVQRKATVRMYEQEIAELYASMEIR